MISKVLIFYYFRWANCREKVDTGRATNKHLHKKAPFTIIHQMNEVKNHVGCLSESIKKADQDLEISDSIVLARKLKNSLHRQGYQRAGA